MGISDSKFCFGKLKTNKISAGIKSDADATLSEKQKDLLENSWKFLKAEIIKIGVVTFTKWVHLMVFLNNHNLLISIVRRCLISREEVKDCFRINYIQNDYTILFVYHTISFTVSKILSDLQKMKYCVQLLTRYIACVNKFRKYPRNIKLASLSYWSFCVISNAIVCRKDYLCKMWVYTWVFNYLVGLVTKFTV